MSMTPSQTILTNELKLHDFKNTKLSITFGDADINDGYSYARMNFRANDIKFDMWIDKPVFNFICDDITLNDRKIWHQDNDGPNSGLNADMLDGMHAAEFKDRYGHHHFLHMFYTSGGKKFVKLATFTTRKVGDAPDFNINGTPPYQGIFPFSGNGVQGINKEKKVLQSLAVKDEIASFKANTPRDLKDFGHNLFKTTDMLTEGVYNGTLRATVSLLKLGEPTTFDIHIGLFEDPMNTIVDGWAGLHKYFYVSLHNNDLPFIDENYPINKSKVEDALNKRNVMLDALNGKIDKSTASELLLADANKPNLLADVSNPNPYEQHERPFNKSGYVKPADPTKDYIKPQPFPPYKHEGKSYQQYLDIMRLYHVDTHVDTVDGVQVITHQFDLYLAIDEKCEVHLQPYMSSACLLYNFEKPISESQLPQTNFMRPKSIYDDRYSHVNHRHYEYEEKIWDLVEEVDQIWDAFDHYVVIAQGESNAKKVLMTDEKGDVFCAKDNFERHEDSRRKGKRVLISTINKCIAESEITIEELAQLKGVKSNIQQQINELLKNLSELVERVTEGEGEISNIWGDLSEIWKKLGDFESRISYLEEEIKKYVKKSGDTMTGNLTMNKCRVYFNGDGRSGYVYGATSDAEIGLANADGWVMRHKQGDGAMSFRANSIIIGNKRLTIGSNAPSNPANGDVWIKNS